MGREVMRAHARRYAALPPDMNSAEYEHRVLEPRKPGPRRTTWWRGVGGASGLEELALMGTYDGARDREQDWDVLRAMWQSPDFAPRPP